MPVALNNDNGGTYDRSEVRPLALHSSPQIEGITGIYFLSAGEAIGVQNLVEGGVQPTEVGAIVWEDGFAAMSRAAGYLETNLPETLAATIVFVGKRAAAAGTPFVGNYIDGTRRGIGVYSVGSQQTVSVISDRGSVDGLAVSVTGAPASWRLYSAQIPAAAAMTMTDHTANVTVTGTQTTARVIEDAGTLKVGAFSAGSTFNGVVHISVAVVANRVLTADEIAEVVTWCRAAAAFGGQTV